MPATGWFPPPSADRCPSCEGPVERHRCLACGLRLAGPPAATLWWIDGELHRLSGQRIAVLTQLRRASDREAAPATAPGGPAFPADPGPFAVARQPRPDRRPPPPSSSGARSGPPAGPEAEPADLQNLLLGLGAFLLAVAAVVFATVTWSRLSAGIQGGVLVGFTAAAVAGAGALHRRGLEATAEAIGSVAVILALVDAHAARISLAPNSAPLLFWSGATLVLAAGAWALSRLVPLASARISAVVLVQLALPFLLVGLEVGGQPLALGLLAQAAVLVIVLAVVLPGRNGATELLFGIGAATAWFSGAGIALTALAAAAGSEAAGPAATVLAAAAVAGLLGLWWEDGRRVALGIATTLGFAALAGALEPAATGDVLVLVLGSVAAAVLGAGVQAVRRSSVDRSWVDGPLLVGALGAVAALLPLVVPAAEAIGRCLPTHGLWAGDLGRSARSALGASGGWDGSAVTWWYLALAGAVALAAGGWPRQTGPGDRRAARAVGPWLAAAWLAVALPLVPLLVGTSVVAAVAWLLAWSVLAFGLLVARQGRPAPAWVVGATTAVTALGWALHGPWATVVVLATFTAIAGAVSWRVEPRATVLPAGAATMVALAVVLVPVVQRAGGAGVEAAWFGLAVAAIAASALGWLFDLAVPARARALPPPPAAAGGTSVPTRPMPTPFGAPIPPATPLRRAAVAVEVTAAALAVIGLWAAGANGTPDQLSIALALGTVAALAHGTRPTRRFLLPVAAGGALVLIWQRLALGQVTTVEAYSLPAAALLLGVGWWFRDRADSSWVWCGPALATAFLPTTLVALHDPGLARSLGALAAAAAVVLVGARSRLQAPVVVGSTVLVVLGLRHLGPVVDHLPRWVLFATAGAVLISVGATYERRRLGLARLGDHLRGLR